MFNETQSNCSIESTACILTIESQGLASREEKRENTVNMRYRESVGGVERDLVHGNIMTEVKIKEGRPEESLLFRGNQSVTHHFYTTTSV